MKQPIDDFLNHNRYYLYITIIITFIIVHGKFDGFFKIDDITLLLLLLLFILPYIPLIKKWRLKYGDFEAEVTTEEIKAIEKKVNEIPQKGKSLENEKDLDLKELAESDPQLALAKIRIEIEKQLKLLFNIYIPENARYGSRLSPRLTVESLRKRDIIEQPLATVLQDIINIANRAIHGEDISTNNALKLIETANKALAELEFVILNHALKSAKVEIVNKNAVNEYSNAEYLLTTITPLVKRPKKSTYKINQVELGTFLENYGEYAEFIVELKKIDKKIQPSQ